MDNYLPIIGLEIHVELKTKSKMFCGCKNDPFHAPKPNIYTCPVCLGLPGALPVPNKQAVEWTLMLGMALNCEIPLESKFDRKNYFYPDLPKGYQISQYDQPLAVNGWLDVELGTSSRTAETHAPDKNQNFQRVGITRVHLEEDAGKLQHATINGKKLSLIDFNRSGVPLVEIVTEPDIRSAQEARAFLKKLHQIIKYLGISDANMEEGSMRLEPNISVIKRSFVDPTKQKKISTSIRAEPIKKTTGRSKHDQINLPNYKVEVKNINSFKFASRAIDFEVKRQIDILEKGQTPKQETRGWDEKKGITLPQRSKEEAHDYRYFPEPDIPPMRWTNKFIANLRRQIPELPEAKINRFVKDFHLPLGDAQRLVEEKELADYFELTVGSSFLARKAASFQMISGAGQDIKPKTIVNWLLNKRLDITKISPDKFLDQIAAKQQRVAVDEKKLDKIINEVLTQNPQAVASYKAGKVNSIMFLVGQTLKTLQGKGDPQIIRNLLEKKLK